MWQARQVELHHNMRAPVLPGEYLLPGAGVNVRVGEWTGAFLQL